MASVLKTSITADKSNLVDGQPADAGDVISAADSLIDNDRAGRVSNSATDTHVKHASDLLLPGEGLTRTVNNSGADETQTWATDSKVKVSSNDTGRGYLEDKIGVGTGMTEVTENDGGSEIKRIGLHQKFIDFFNSYLQSGGKIPAGAIDSSGYPSGYSAQANGSGGTGFAAEGGGGALPMDRTITAGEDLDELDRVFLDRSDNKWYKVDTDDTTPLCGDVRAVVNESGGIAQDASGSARIYGEVSGYTGLTPGAKVYSSTTPGGYTQTRPNPAAGAGQVIIDTIGEAVTSTSIFVQPSPVLYLKREVLTTDDTLTITHHADSSGRGRKVRTFPSSTEPGATLATYASSNQDSSVRLRELPTPATYGSDQCTGGTPLAAATNGSTPAANLVDDNNTTITWDDTNTGGSAVNSHFGYQFGAAKTIRRISYVVASSGGYTSSYAAADLKIQYSDDGSAWTDAQSYSGLDTTPGNTVNLDLTVTQGAHLYWRMKPTSSISLGWALADMSMLEAATFTGTAKDRLGQSFQISSTGTVDQVKLWLRKVGAPSGTLTLRIETDSSGSPSGTLANAAATVTVAESSLATSYGWIAFDFASNFSLTGTTLYWLVLSTDRSASGTAYVEWGADASTPGYTDGQMISEASSSWSAESKDAVFEVIAPGTVFDGECLCEFWTFTGYASMVHRFADGSAANGDTNTTFKATTDIDVTCMVEIA